MHRRSGLAASFLHPIRVEDEDFDLTWHVLRMALPSPGGTEELTQLCGDPVGTFTALGDAGPGPSHRAPPPGGRHDLRSSPTATEVEDPRERLEQLSVANALTKAHRADDPGPHPAGLGRVRRTTHLRVGCADGRPRLPRGRHQQHGALRPDQDDALAAAAAAGAGSGMSTSRLAAKSHASSRQETTHAVAGRRPSWAMATSVWWRLPGDP